MYIEIILGLISYILYFIYDFNSIHKKTKLLGSFFWLGSLILFGTTIYAIIHSFTKSSLPQIIISAILITIFLFLEVDTLFFQIPFKETYIKENNKRLCYTKGMYSICRHPGVLWYIGLYLSLWGLSANLVEGVFFILMILLDIIYIIYQDIYIFPRTFSNYMEYKKTTPFLIPHFGGKK